MESNDTPNLLRWETLSERKFHELDRRKCVVMVTCSPLEVHGPHLPLGADCLEGQGLAQRAIRFLPEPHRSLTFIQLPFIYTASDPLPHPGSIYFHPDTTVRVLTELGNSLAAQGFQNVIVSNFHGSPRHFLSIEKACHRVSKRRGINMVSLFSVLLTRLTGGSAELYEVLGDVEGIRKDDLVGDTHAGIVETSQLLALHPEWVEKDYTELPRRTVDGWLTERGEEIPPGARGEPASIPNMINAFKAGLRFFRAETYCGAPAGASAEIGEQILDKLGGFAAEAVTEVLEGRLKPEDCHSPLWSKRFLFTNPVLVRFFNRWLHIPDGVS